MTLFEILNLRTEYESISRDLKGKWADSDLTTLKLFTINGHKSNRFRDGYTRALELACIIISEIENEKTNLSSLRGQEIKAI